MELREIGWKGVDWIDVSQDKDNWTAGSATHGTDPSGSIQWSFLDYVTNYQVLKNNSAPCSYLIIRNL